jgi:N-acyl-L-homoserine lactone synthetase
MRNATAQKIETPATDSGLENLLEGYRFYVAEDADTFARALDVRREVYVENFGYDVPVPDEYDHRSWLLVAEHVESGEIIGTMRMTPRNYGPIEAEEYFTLPNDLDRADAIEISRFAILAGHRKTKTFLPVVSVGLYNLCYELALLVGAERQIVCSKAERLWSYQSMGFQGTGITTRYEKLNGCEHELLFHDFRDVYATVHSDQKTGNPFEELWALELDEVIVPTDVPPLGLVDEPTPEYRIAVGA